jgi:hypothetical protein
MNNGNKAVSGCCLPGTGKLAADKTSARVDTAAVKPACPHLPSCLEMPHVEHEVLLSKDQLEINAPSYARWGWCCAAGAKCVAKLLQIGQDVSS